MSLAVLLAQKNSVKILEEDTSKIKLIEKKIPTINDDGLKAFWKKNNLEIFATKNKKIAYEDSDFVIVCTPTNYDEVKIGGVKVYSLNFN